jgi:hypothetical protein
LRDLLRAPVWRGAAALAMGAVALAACVPPPPPPPPPPPTVAPTTTTTVPPTTTPTPPVPRPFSPDSPWYSPVANAQGTGDYTYGDEIGSEIAQYYQHASLNTTKYAPALYTVGADQPTVAVGQWDCGQNNAAGEFLERMSAVPLPADALIPPDSDAHVGVWQPSTDTVWELYKARIVDGQWQACWGGRIDHASTSSGTFPFPYGPTATGLSLFAGTITLADLRSGVIDHAVAIGVVRTRRKLFSYPANRTDGRFLSTSSIPEGQRLRLDPSVDVASLPLTPLGKMVALALQRYGLIVRDTSGAVSFYGENPLPVMTGGAPDPYTAFFGGKAKWAQLDGIPWNRLEAMPLDYGAP